MRGSCTSIRADSPCFFQKRPDHQSLMAGGLYSFIREIIPCDLFLIDEFVFFDFSTPLLILIIEYILIMCLFMILGTFSSR